jgi:DNA-binding transcriptional ArsR family regulator
MPEESWEPAEYLVVDDVDALKATAGTIRIRLIELLRRRSATVKELAASLEMNPKSLYYHINQLERHALIRVVGTRLVSGIMEKRYRATAYVFRYVDLAAPGRATAPALLQDFVTSQLQITAEEIRLGIAQGRITPDPGSDGEDRSLRVAWTLLRLRPDEAADLAARLDAVLSEFQALPDQHDGVRRGTYRFLQALFPTYRRAPGGDEPAEATR